MNDNEPIETRLQQIWQQGHRSMAAAFLRRAITPESTLAEVAAALQFTAVRDFLNAIRLRDVMATTARPQPMPIPPRAIGATKAKKRKRRGPQEMKEIKVQLLEMLRHEPGSLDTTQMHEGLAKMGHELDRITLNRLLAQLQDEQQITCLGGRPKAWRVVSRAAVNASFGREQAGASLS
jgi:hypothetical protein